ncbi:MAG TPA: LytR C-terminal domain-containing protein [Solirubrobacteraceae bacterium]|nr:LytR C-terminal domain-containing protein [Solirubrobacteraceae bacterium]
MTHLPLAFSIHHFISSVGADAGFASIIGLAILVLLYFAQARETSTLRERADGAEQHAAQLEARLSQVAQAARAQAQQAGPRPAPSPIARPLANPAVAARSATATAAAPAGSASAGPTPFAPPGVGAPALADATRLIPLPSKSVAPQPEAVPAVAASVAVSATSESESKPVSPAPATAAGVAASAGGLRAAVAEPEVPVGAGNGAGSDTIAHPLPDDPAEEPLPRVQLRSSASRARQLPPLTRPPSNDQRSRGGRALVAVIGVLGVAAVVAVLLIVTSSGGKSSPNSTTSTSNAPSSRHKQKTAKVFNRAAVTVTVLNGTSTAGLAAHILQELGGQGYKQGSAANASSATQATTVVSYVNGQKAAALQVAKSLNLAQSSVAPITSSTQSIACPQPSCNVDVVVTVGQDLASQ